MEEARRENSAGNETSNDTNNQSKSETLENQKRVKSCKGCLYYSSTFKPNSRHPLCFGVSRSLPHVPHNIFGEAKKVETSKEGKSIREIKYGCIGYSVYSYGKDLPANEQGSTTELPGCVGLEVVAVNGVRAPGSVPAHAHNKEDAHAYPQNQTQKPAHSAREDFFNRFSRSATLVANGVVKNLCKVGNHIKDRVDDILYPYRRRPK